MIPITLIAFITLVTSSALWAQEPPAEAQETANPQVKESLAPPGSPKEKENFEKAAEPQIGQPQRPKRPTAPPGGEVTDSLAPNERPSLKFLEKERSKKFPQHQNRLENDKVRNPKEFEVEYHLQENARVSVTIIREDGLPMRNFEIPPGYEGAKAGKNRVIIWDGRDDTNREAEDANYMALQHIQYEKSERKEMRMIPIKKEKGAGP